MRRGRFPAVVVALVVLAAACADRPSAAPEAKARGGGGPGPATIAAVGDMVCHGPAGTGSDPTATDRRLRRGFCQYGKVSDLVANGNYDRFLTLGDLQYYFGRYRDFRTYYGPTFGRVKSITAPSPGNHESYTSNREGKPFAGYRKYFGARAHWNLRGGSYSYDLGAWHIVSLNSQWCMSYTWVFHHGRWSTVPTWPTGSPWGCHKGDPLFDWFAHDLATHTNQCSLVYFHHPSYFGVGNGWPGGTGSLIHGVYSMTKPLYRVFYRYGGDVVLAGHEHFYQRTVPIDPLGKADPAFGFAEFIVGTGGDTLQPMPPIERLPDEIAAASNTAFGILRMDLRSTSYHWKFVPVPGSPGHWQRSPRYPYKIFVNGNGRGYVDEGAGTCHGRPPR